MGRKTAIAYIRVSTDGQAQDDKFGRDAQRMAILDYADRNGYVITRWYEEIGCGAEERPILENICYGDDVQNPPVQTLIVYKQDRVARDTELFFVYTYFLKKKGIDIVSVVDNVDREDPMWAIRMALVQMIAEQERKNITIRTMAGRNVKAQNGGYCGGKAPYGYYVSNGELLVNEEEAEIVRLVFKWKAEGLGLRKTASALDELGYKARNGKPFSFNTVYSILGNEKTYKGYYKFGDNDWTKGKHEAILEGED